VKRSALVALAVILTACSSGKPATSPVQTTTVTTTATASPTGPPTEGPGADVKFLAAVRNVPHAFDLLGTADTTLIEGAKSDCDALHSGMTFVEVKAEVRKLVKDRVGLDTIDAMVRAAIDTYCPDEKSAIGE
jgi:hypothetical protein